MSEPREYGDFDPSLDSRAPISEVNLSCMPLDVIAHWRRCSIMADSLADFTAYNFDNIAAAQNIISTVVNELLENAVKFSSRKRDRIGVSVAHYGETLRITTTNVTSAERAAALGALIEELHQEDIERIFTARIESSVASKQQTSGLGLLSVRKDYKARIGVRLTGLDGGAHCQVLVDTRMDVEELEQNVESRPFGSGPQPDAP